MSDVDQVAIGGFLATALAWLFGMWLARRNTLASLAHHPDAIPQRFKIGGKEYVALTLEEYASLWKDHLRMEKYEDSFGTLPSEAIE